MPEQTQTQSFLSIEGLQAYGIVLTEQQYLTLCGLVDNYAASAIAQVANAAKAAIAAVSIVDVGSNANIQYIAANCAQWTDGSLQTLPDGTQITYHTTTTYIGNESA